MEPKCILMDEPTAMLDPVGRREVLETVRRLNKEKGITVILITHYMEEVIDADRIFVMSDGKVAMQGTPREIFARVDELRELRLEVPQVTELAHEVINRGVDMPAAVLTPEEFTAEYCKAAAGRIRSGADTENEGAPDANGNNVGAEGNDADMASGSTETGRDNASGADGAVLSLQNVGFVYGENTAYETVAVEGVNLDIFQGEYIGLIGHTGSGKSTLIQLLNGLEKATSGTVRFRGEDIWADGYNRRALRSNVGLVFQYPDHQLFEATVLEDVSYGPRNQGLSEEEVKECAEWALTLVGVDKKQWTMSPLELSGGQKRRVAIAGVLAMKPKVLILDEPTAGLDPAGRDEILGEIDRIRRETGMTVILVSHRMEDVARFADRLVVISDGHILYADTPREVFHHRDELTEVGLEVPQVTQVMQMLRREGIPCRTDAITIAEALEALL
jgi:energy-coupling factor transport system ATP-binding protein